MVDARQTDLDSTVFDFSVFDLDLDDRAIDEYQFVGRFCFAELGDHIEDIQDDRFGWSAADFVEGQFGFPFCHRWLIERDFERIDMQGNLAVEPSGFCQEGDCASEAESNEFLGDRDLVEQCGREDFDARVAV